MFRNIFKKVRESELIALVPPLFIITVPITGAVIGYRSVEEQTARAKFKGVSDGMFIAFCSPLILLVSPIYLVCYVLTLDKDKDKNEMSKIYDKEVEKIKNITKIVENEIEKIDDKEITENVDKEIKK